MLQTEQRDGRQGSSVGRVLIGGVGYRWQRDGSFGLAVSDALALQTWPENVDILDLGYGALYVAMDLADAQPPYDRIILISSASRERAPGRLYEEPWAGSTADEEEIQARVREAGAGVVDLDHLLVIAKHFDALPPDVRTLEVEPIDIGGGDGLSPQLEALLPQVVARARELACPAQGAVPR